MSDRVKLVIQAVLRRIGLRYAFYKVYSIDLGVRKNGPDQGLAPGYSVGAVDAATIQHAADPLIRDQAWYGGEDALGFAIFHDGEPVSLQWIWHGERYRRSRNFISLAESSAKSVQLVTVVKERGQGLATQLKQFSAKQLAQLGFNRLYSRIWWSNAPSIRVSKKAGWTLSSTVATFSMGKSKHWLRIAFSSGSSIWKTRFEISFSENGSEGQS